MRKRSEGKWKLTVRKKKEVGSHQSRHLLLTDKLTKLMTD